MHEHEQEYEHAVENVDENDDMGVQSIAHRHILVSIDTMRDEGSSPSKSSGLRSTPSIRTTPGAVA